MRSSPLPGVGQGLAITANLDFGSLALLLDHSLVPHKLVELRDGLDAHDPSSPCGCLESQLNGGGKTSQRHFFLDLENPSGRIDQEVPSPAVHGQLRFIKVLTVFLFLGKASLSVGVLRGDRRFDGGREVRSVDLYLASMRGSGHRQAAEYTNYEGSQHPDLTRETGVADDVGNRRPRATAHSRLRK